MTQRIFVVARPWLAIALVLALLPWGGLAPKTDWTSNLWMRSLVESGSWPEPFWRQAPS